MLVCGKIRICTISMNSEWFGFFKKGVIIVLLPLVFSVPGVYLLNEWIRERQIKTAWGGKETKKKNSPFSSSVFDFNFRYSFPFGILIVLIQT